MRTTNKTKVRTSGSIKSGRPARAVRRSSSRLATKSPPKRVKGNVR